MRNIFSRRGIEIAALALLVGCGTIAQAEAPPSLPGTNWGLLSLTSKGEEVQDAQTPADVEFLKTGEWGVLHYGGSRQGGKYTVKGDQLTMKTEDGDVYMSGKMTLKGDDLEIYDGTWLMRLRKIKSK